MTFDGIFLQLARLRLGGAVGFEVFMECFGEMQHLGISRQAVRSLFSIVEAESKPDHWRVCYDAKDSCLVCVTPLASDPHRLKSLYVDRPCGDLRLWEALLSILRMGSIVMFWPGGPPVVSDDAIATNLPADVTAALGPAKSVRSAEELLRAVQES
jgi:hypothetical protein